MKEFVNYCGRRLPRTEITPEILERVKREELEILKVVRDFCLKNDIEMLLAYGTLLGAVRHEGFIPWDDDIDVYMTREDYNRFISLWQKSHPAGYLLQNKDTDRDYTQVHTKIRKDNTTFLQQGEENYLYHKGIFIDIFPLDRIPGGFRRKVYKMAAMVYLLYMRGFIPPEANRIVRLGSRVILGLTPKKLYYPILKIIEKYITGFSSDEMDMACVVSINDMNNSIPAEVFSKHCELKFEDDVFFAPKDYDKYLTIMYGDYMELPPEEERVWKHRPLVIDLERNIEDIDYE